MLPGHRCNVYMDYRFHGNDDVCDTLSCSFDCVYELVGTYGYDWKVRSVIVMSLFLQLRISRRTLPSRRHFTQKHSYDERGFPHQKHGHCAQIEPHLQGCPCQD